MHAHSGSFVIAYYYIITFFAGKIVPNSKLELSKSTFHDYFIRRASTEWPKHIWELLTYCLKSIGIYAKRTHGVKACWM